MGTMNGGYSKLAAEYNGHLRGGELGKCGKDICGRKGAGWMS